MTDDSNSKYGTFLTALLSQTRPVVEGRWFKDNTISLDGYHFKRCRFDKCVLRTNIGDFEMTDCFVAQDSYMQFADRGTRQVQLFHIFFPSLDVYWPTFSPRRNPDGTFTITGIPST